MTHWFALQKKTARSMATLTLCFKNLVCVLSSEGRDTVPTGVAATRSEALTRARHGTGTEVVEDKSRVTCAHHARSSRVVCVGALLLF